MNELKSLALVQVGGVTRPGGGVAMHMNGLFWGVSSSYAPPGAFLHT